MEQLNQNISLLNQLLMINHNTEKVYLEAMNASESEELKQFFRARAFERNEFCRYLGAEIKMLGGVPNFSGKMENSSKIIWPDFKKIIASKNSKHLMTEIKRLKSLCLSNYNNVLTSIEFPESLVRLLERQKQIIGSSISFLRNNDVLASNHV